MTQLHVEADGTTRATPEAVWALIADAGSYPRWGPWDDGGYRSPGNGGEQGVGAVRWFRLGRTTTVERVVGVEVGRRLAYTVVGGIPVRNYKAEVTLAAVAGATRIHWAATWDPTVLGRIVERRLRRFYPEMMAMLVKAADETALAP
jgi:uncharacterized protein YndB with AHSA1/START domain